MKTSLFYAGQTYTFKEDYEKAMGDGLHWIDLFFGSDYCYEFYFF